tara:strand:- start:7448 stop:9073 length:1626 start_codon:yes stop_codon:yes gene_type:complete
MRAIHTDPELKALEDRVLHYAVDVFGRTLPEMRFFILDPMEFASLLLKRVYPVSPVNIWEGKDMVSKRYRIESGQESSLYYEVVQTGRPSYAYLNETNSPMVQASVMAHVVGHCEFSELNVLKDSNDDRTEYVVHLTNQVNRSRPQMGELHYQAYWNAAESLVPLISPNSQYNLESSVDTDLVLRESYQEGEEKPKAPMFSVPYSHTLSEILQSPNDGEILVKKEQRKKERQETLSRRGYKLRAPCQDIMGFLRRFAPTSRGERSILDYLYTVNSTQDFVIRTQIMNEGWAMHWEHKIMKELFAEKACSGIIDYCKIFAGVCYPRPYFQRNPYHLGFYMWKHIEELFRQGRVSLDYMEETDMATKQTWNRPKGTDPLTEMEKIVKTCTDYEFLRRFLNESLVEEFHLNRIPKAYATQLGIRANDVAKENAQFVWIDPKPVKEEMLEFFTHFYRPRIYLIDVDFMEGGLLLYHRDDGRDLRKKWIKPTLKNINMIWKGAVSLLCKDSLYTLSAGKFRKEAVTAPDFAEVADRMRSGEKPFRI